MPLPWSNLLPPFPRTSGAMQVCLGLLLLALWALATRFPLPIDETRYLTVAWEMWNRGDFLVPYLNGEPYSHKPPLLFWLIHAGWAVGGVGDFWPRALPALLAAGLVWTVRSHARGCWPAHPGIAGVAPLLLGGSAFFLIFSTFIMFDLLLALCVALAARACWQMGEGAKPWRAALAMGLWTGLGVLAKGPVVLAFMVPLWLSGPWWHRSPRARGRRWWAQVGLALLVAVAVALVWALPAAASGGALYADALLFKQTSGRVVHSFAHQRPFWYYAVFLPLLWLPWSLWPRAWQAMRAVVQVRDAASRFLWVWALGPVLVLSIVSGKQPQYLLPVLAPGALLLARGFSLTEPRTAQDRGAVLPGLLGVGLGLVMLVGAFGFGPLPPADPFSAWHRGWLADTSWLLALATLGLGALLPFMEWCSWWRCYCIACCIRPPGKPSTCGLWPATCGCCNKTDTRWPSGAITTASWALRGGCCARCRNCWAQQPARTCSNWRCVNLAPMCCWKVGVCRQPARSRWRPIAVSGGPCCQ